MDSSSGTRNALPATLPTAEGRSRRDWGPTRCAHGQAHDQLTRSSTGPSTMGPNWSGSDLPPHPLHADPPPSPADRALPRGSSTSAQGAGVGPAVNAERSGALASSMHGACLNRGRAIVECDRWAEYRLGPPTAGHPQ